MRFKNFFHQNTNQVAILQVNLIIITQFISTNFLSRLLLNKYVVYTLLVNYVCLENFQLDQPFVTVFW